jgi:hypothetical protein
VFRDTTNEPALSGHSGVISFEGHRKYLLIDCLSFPVPEEGAKAKRILNTLFIWREKMSKEVAGKECKNTTALQTRFQAIRLPELFG